MADVEKQVINYSSDEENTKKPVKATKKPAKKGQKAKAAPKKGPNLHASSFEDFHLKQELMRAISEVGFEHPSEGNLKSAKRRNPSHHVGRGFAVSGKKRNGQNGCFCSWRVAFVESEWRPVSVYGYLQYKGTCFSDK